MKFLKIEKHQLLFLRE